MILRIGPNLTWLISLEEIRTQSHRKYRRVKTQWDDGHWKAKERPPKKSTLPTPWPLTLELWQNNFLLFKPLKLWSFIMVALENIPPSKSRKSHTKMIVINFWAPALCQDLPLALVLLSHCFSDKNHCDLWEGTWEVHGFAETTLALLFHTGPGFLRKTCSLFLDLSWTTWTIA